MPRPWFESSAVLAFGPPAGPLRPRLTYWRPRLEDPRAQAASDRVASDSAPNLLRYALLRQGRAELDSRPVGFPDLPSLARAIERERQAQPGGGRPLELVERDDFEFEDDDQLHTVVEIWTLDMGNSRDQRIGVAWLNEGGREQLEPALRAARSDRPKAQPRRAA